MTSGGRTVACASVAVVVAALAVGGCGRAPVAGPAATTSAPTTTGPAATSTSTPPTTELPPTTVPADRTLVAFGDPSTAEGWSTVDDRVMGGVSRSTVQWEDGRLRFSGTVSLENNGGFSSARGPVGAVAAPQETTTAFVVTAEGDGTTYLLQVTDAEGGRWVQRFATAAGMTVDHVLPVSGFEPVTSRLNPRSAAGPMDPARVVQFTVYVVDDQIGPFDLRIVRLAAR